MPTPGVLASKNTIYNLIYRAVDKNLQPAIKAPNYCEPKYLCKPNDKRRCLIIEALVESLCFCHARVMADPTEKDKCMRFRVHVLNEIYETEEAFVRKIDFVVQVS